VLDRFQRRDTRGAVTMFTTTDFGGVTVEARGAIAIIHLNDPKTLNAASPGMMLALSKALSHIEAGQQYRCAVLTGTGRGFCSGANLTTTGPDDILKQADLGAVLRDHYAPVLRQMRELRVPLIVAVNGPALGIGFSIALMGDLIIAARSAYFQLSFSRIGLVPDGAAAWLLSRIVGFARTRELVILAERLSAEKALAWGLVNEVVDDDGLVERAHALAAEIVQRPGGTLPLLRRACWQALDNSYEEQLALETALQSQAGAQGDYVEAVTAFREKRAPVFRKP
jgi:2-(1,2-epoxy-1,2-dihydrophenyl)acetyl-CoA isomerase